MTKFSLCIFTVAVLLGAATSDFMCVARQLIAVTPDDFFTRPISSCMNVELRFNRVRSGLKKCTRHEIDTSLLEALHNDFCTLHSDYRQKFNRQELCLIHNMPNVRSCLQSLMFSPNLSPHSIRGTSIKELCTSVSVDVADCLADKVGRPCGHEGLEVYGRITEASKPFFKGTCLVAASSVRGEIEVEDEEDTNHRFEAAMTEFEASRPEFEASRPEFEASRPESETAKPEDTIVGVVVAESISTGVACDAAPNYALLWCILLGLLLTVK